MLNGVHGIIIGGVQTHIGDECVHDPDGKLIQLTDLVPTRELRVGIIRAHGAHKIASFLRGYGADIEVLDYAFAWEIEELKDLWKSRYNSKTLFLCVSATFRISSYNLWAFVGWVRENYPHIHIIGGTQSVDKLLPYKLDYYVFGYGEYAMLELVKCLKDDTPGKLKIYKLGNKKIINAQKDYKAYPKKELYISYEDRDFIKEHEILPMELARGCIFQCAFCTYPILGVRGDHSRDENDLYREMLENYERWGTTQYTLSDETVNDYHEKLERYAKVIKKLPFKPKMGGYARGDLIVGRKKSWETYVEMGFMNHFYGIESMYHPAAKAVGKGMESGKLKEGLIEWKEWAYKNSDFYAGFISLIAGLPNETYKTLDETRLWLKKNWSDNFSSMGTLSLNIPYYEGEYKQLAEELGNLSLIERDPEKYGYKIIDISEKTDLWQNDILGGEISYNNKINDLSDKYKPKDQHHFGINPGRNFDGTFTRGSPAMNAAWSKDDKSKKMPIRPQVNWESNTGVTTFGLAKWFQEHNSTVITKGTIPTWAFGEFLVDERYTYNDMMMKNDKHIDMDSILYSNGNVSRYTQQPAKSFIPADENAIDIPEIDGVQFTSAGKINSNRTYEAKKKFIRDYKGGKINA